MSGYKAILPSSLLTEHGKEQIGSFNHEFKNFSLKTGVIIGSYEVDSEENALKIGPEYDVAVFEQDANRGVASTIYKNCQYIEQMGGVGDFLDIKRRSPDKKDYKVNQEPENQNGAMVLLLCADGVSSKGIIIGALTHPKRKTTLTKENGHHMEGEFNGLNWKVDKDGALTITFKSATDNDGKPQDEESGGTFIEINKKGSVDINAALEGDDETYMRMDKPNKDVGLKAGHQLGLTSKDNMGFNSGKNLNIKVKKDLIAACEGKASFDVKSSYDIKAGAKMSVEAQQVMVKSKSMIQMKASSMFQAEASSTMILKAPQVLLGPSASQPALLAYQLITLGTGNLGAPVISNAIAGYSTSVLLSS